MRYANQMDPFQREAVQGAMQQYIAPVNMNREANGLNMEQHNGNIPQQNDGNPFMEENNFFPPPQPQELGQEEDERLLLGEEEDGEHQEEEILQQPLEQHAIPVPNKRAGRRPYHALARENAEALNALLTREIPQLTNQLQHSMELMNQLIEHQLDN